MNAKIYDSVNPEFQEGEKRILVVDDDEAIRQGFSQLLTLSGYDVTMASNGAIARHLYKSKPFDLVITDILMPGEDGLTLILQLTDFDEDAKIIAVSGGGRTKNQGLLEIARNLGAVQTLFKPVSADTLLNTVQEILTAASTT